LWGPTSASHLLHAHSIAVGLSPYFEIRVLTHQNNLIFPALCSFMRQDVAEAETQAVVSKHLSVFTKRHCLHFNLYCDTSTRLTTLVLTGNPEA
jgi:hypothetical protein